VQELPQPPDGKGCVEAKENVTMKTGRPPLPTAIKAAQGTLRKHREAGKGPDARPLKEAPPVPEQFSGRDDVMHEGAAPEALARLRRSSRQRALAGRTFLELADVLMADRVLTARDVKAVEVCAHEYARWRVLASIVEEEGEFFDQRSAKGVVLSKVAHPVVAQMDRALANFERLLTQLGLTPSARARVRGIADVDEEENPFAQLLRLRTGADSRIGDGTTADYD
jgi:P27 family predicted phage terminase small subunit